MNHATKFVIAIALLSSACDAGAPEKATGPSSGESKARRTDQLPVVNLVGIIAGGGKGAVEQSNDARAFDGNPEQIAAGRQLYLAYNCVGCHFNGGGGMGPPLMDDKWIFGSSMEHIASTIQEGRPGGMPSFRHLATKEQLWQLAAYVRSLSDLARKNDEGGVSSEGKKAPE
jgi:cytochrome c oxidase cbb3-type subunit 3